MYAPTNSRRIGQIRSSRSGSGGDVDLEHRRDDKNNKADTDVESTVNFVVCLLIAVVLACVGLYMRHSYRVVAEALHPVVQNAQVVARATIPHVNMNNAAQSESSAQIHFQTVQKTALHLQSESTLKQGESKPRREQPKPKSHTSAQPELSHKLSRFSPPLDYVHTEITWPGCVDSIPNPDRALDPAPESLKKSAPYDYNRRHIVPPPPGPVTLVCCETTKGTLNIEVHPAWAPNGAARFLDMVNTGFFSTQVGLFRALNGFLVQFGLPGDPAVLKGYHKMGNLPDDPHWLPLGPTGREINGTQRFRRGYLAYAGAGRNSRGTQLIMAFQDNLYLGGGSPWEVPFAQVYGFESYSTLGKIYTKYGEAPSQGKIMNRGKEYLKEDFPLLDYITQCSVMKENVPWTYEHAHV